MALHYSYKDIQLPQLRGFCLAATSHSFTAAAKALGLSVPAVWQQVRALERELGASLLRRNGAKVDSTRANDCGAEGGNQGVRRPRNADEQHTLARCEGHPFHDLRRDGRPAQRITLGHEPDGWEGEGQR